MGFSGVCHICESAEADRSCERCGALVCDEHYDRELRMCTECAAQVRQEGRDADGDPGTRL